MFPEAIAENRLCFPREVLACRLDRATWEAETCARRNIFQAAATSVGGVLPQGYSSRRGRRGGKVSANKVAYHLSDADKVAFVLGNIQNHLDGGPKGVEIVLVVQGRR